MRSHTGDRGTGDGGIVGDAYRVGLHGWLA